MMLTQVNTPAVNSSHSSYFLHQHPILLAICSKSSLSTAAPSWSLYLKPQLPVPPVSLLNNGTKLLECHQISRPSNTTNFFFFDSLFFHYPHYPADGWSLQRFTFQHLKYSYLYFFVIFKKLFYVEMLALQKSCKSNTEFLFISLSSSVSISVTTV
jgi:hypothetical protein